MKLRQLIGLVVTGTSLLFLGACGDDNDTFVPPTPVPTATTAPTNTPRNTNTTGVPMSPTPTPTFGNGGGVCGNGSVDTGEDCDDGNADGGDGCAANCTSERDVACVFGGETGALVQTGIFALPLSFTGSQTLTAGDSTVGTVETTDGKTFKEGDIPVIIKEENLTFDPVMVPGLVCACVRAVADPDTLGPGNAGAGTVGCGPDGLEGVDVLTTIDHNTNDIDPTCANGTPDTMNPSVCNGKPIITNSGSGPQGSAVIATSTSITTVSDGGTCAMQCIEANGPDCIPCTADDPDQVPASAVVTTTGMATGKLFDLNNQPGREIDCDQQCGGSPCACSGTGVGVADCALLNSDPNTGIVGVKLVGAFAQINAPQTGDIVVVNFFECVAP